MELKINNKTKQYQVAPTHLKQLMEWELKEQTSGIAVAVNNRVIPQSQWEEALLGDGDSILIITAAQGG